MDVDQIDGGMPGDLFLRNPQDIGPVGPWNTSFSRAGLGLLISTVTVASPRKEGPRTGEAWITL